MKITIFPWDPQGDGSDEAEEARWCYVCGCGGALVGFLRWNGVEIRGKIPGKMDEDGENLGMNQRKMNEHLEIFFEKCWFFEWDLIHGDFFWKSYGIYFRVFTRKNPWFPHLQLVGFPHVSLQLGQMIRVCLKICVYPPDGNFNMEMMINQSILGLPNLFSTHPHEKNTRFFL